MSKKVHTYEGENVTIRYDAARCIHATECVYGLKAVFNRESRPWVDPAGASVDEIIETIHRCPSGALKYERMDGGPAEAPPARTIVWVIPHGPLHIRGDVHLTTSDGEVAETRLSLCRCGTSSNKPYCDGSHEKIDFKDGGTLGASNLTPGRVRESGPVEVNALANGPLQLSGPFEVADSDFMSRFHGTGAKLCRCGSSRNKPYCDASHNRMGFKG